MQLDLKIECKSLKEMKRVSSLETVKLHFAKNAFFSQLMQGRCPYF